MTAPLEGVRVLEVASWLAAPSCAALMADMGAHVIKVEPPGGDTYRRTMHGIYGADFIHPSFQFDNRGKRGVCVNLESDEGLELVHRLARDADVFITNLTAPRLAKYRLTDADVHALSPSAIYTVLSGYGVDGPDSQRQAFDQTAFWARSGAMSVFGDRDDGLLISRGGYGDRTTCLNLLAAILAAMRVRDRTGEGQYVEVTLQRTGIWALASDVTTALFHRVQPERTSKKAPANPIWNFYETRDGRHLALVMPAVLPYWPKFCAMVDRPDWNSDPRFQTLVGFVEHSQSLIPEITAMFASQDLEYWRTKLDASGLIWEPVALLTEVIEDPALREGGAFSTIVHATGGAMEIIAAPFHIRDADIEVRGPAPDAGQHTREVFAEIGVPAATIDALFAKVCSRDVRVRAVIRAISVTLNGASVTVEAEETASLLDVLRNQFGLTSPRFGCGAGECGTCAVVIDGEDRASCDVEIGNVAGRRVTTVEGIGTANAPHPLQNAFIEKQAGQCGYCLSGLIVGAKVLLDRNPSPTRADVAAALAWHLCRCGVHNRVIDAVLLASQRMREGAP